MSQLQSLPKTTTRPSTPFMHNNMHIELTVKMLQSVNNMRSSPMEPHRLNSRIVQIRRPDQPLHRTPHPQIQE